MVLSNGKKEYNEDGRESKFNNECSLRLTPKGELSLHSDFLEKDIKIKNINMNTSVSIKLECNPYFSAQYSYDQINWIEIYRANVEVEGITEAGLYISPKINPFFYDFFVSHVQLCYTTDTMRIAPHFESYERCFSQMLQFTQVPMDMIDISDKKIIDYFIDLISKKYYINMGLDEFFIPDRRAYNKYKHMHVNFIYGVDKTKKVFKLMGFDRILKFSEIDFDNFFNAIQREIGPATKINLYKYSSKKNPQKLDLDIVVSMLKAYRNGHNSVAVSSTKIIVNNINMPIIYGLKIHEMIINNAKHMEAFIKDIRIAYQIYEHNLIILKMLEFMNHIKVLSSEDYARHLNTFNEILQISVNVKNLIVKNRMKPILNIHARLKELLMDLKSKEEYGIIKLINDLK